MPDLEAARQACHLGQLEDMPWHAGHLGRLVAQ